MHKIRKRVRKLPRVGKAKRFPPRVTFLAGGADFPARSTIPDENEGLLVVVEQPETECLWLVVIAGGDFPASSIIPEENGGLRVVEYKCNRKAIS